MKKVDLPDNSDDKKAHIAFFIPTLGGGGAERVFLRLAKEFVHLGHSVDIVVKEKAGELLSMVPLGVRVIDLKASRMSASLFPLVNFMKSEKPDLIISGLELPNTIAVLARLISRVKTVLIITFHGVIDPISDNSSKRYIEKIFARYLYPLADHYVAVSQGVAEDVKKHYRLPLEQIKIIYNPVPITDIQAKANEPINHRFFEEDVPVILGIGRLSPKKDFKTLVDVFSIIRKKQKARLIILGEGELRKNIESQIKDLCLQNDIDLLGFVENPYPYLKKANVFVLTSVSEGFGLVLVEAIAVGCPIVALESDGGISEVLDHGRYGDILPRENLDLLIETINKAFLRRRVEIPIDWLERFDQKAIASKYLELVK